MDARRFRGTDYYVSPKGKVFHMKPDGSMKQISGYIDRHGGYKRVRVTTTAGKFELARMVYETFRGPIPEGYVIEHVNGCSTMNDLVNLRAVRITDGRRFKGKRKNLRKVVDLRTGKIYRGIRCAERSIGHARKTISNVCSGRVKSRIPVAWYDDVNGKPFRGDYARHHERYMREKA